jgi:hypothetical protein
MANALRFVFPLEMDFSDLLFLLSGLGGLFEGNSCSVSLEWAGSWVLVSLISAASVSSSFYSIILFRLHSFSSWFRLKLTSFILSVKARLSLPYKLLVIKLTQISIFLSSYVRSLFYNSRTFSPSYSSESSWGYCWGGAKVHEALNCSICLNCSLTWRLICSNSLIFRSICAQLAAQVADGPLSKSLYFSF